MELRGVLLVEFTLRIFFWKGAAGVAILVDASAQERRRGGWRWRRRNRTARVYDQGRIAVCEERFFARHGRARFHVVMICSDDAIFASLLLPRLCLLSRNDEVHARDVGVVLWRGCCRLCTTSVWGTLRSRCYVLLWRGKSNYRIPGPCRLLAFSDGAVSEALTGW